MATQHCPPTPIRGRMNALPTPQRRHEPEPVRSYADLTPTVRRGDIYYFTAPSASIKGKVNTVAYCPADDTTLCDCFAAEYGRVCWHVRHVKAAWLIRTARTEIAGYSNAELGHVEREAVAMLAAGIDAEKYSAIYTAVGDEWGDRLLRFPAPPEPDPTPPVAPAVPLRVVPLHELAPTGTEGYRMAPPPAASWPDAGNTDEAACHEAHCAACGHLGLDYVPFFRPEPRSYRAFAVCPKCGHGSEF